MDIIRISLLGICGVVLGFFMKGTRPEYVTFITTGISVSNGRKNTAKSFD